MEPDAVSARHIGMNLRPMVTALAVGVLVSACADGGPDRADRTGTAASDRGTGTGAAGSGRGEAAEVAIRVEQVGGFLPGIELAARSAIVSVYRDGRVIYDGPVPLPYPGPTLPNLQEWRISPEKVASLGERVLAVGDDFGRPSVTDMPDTRFTVATTGGVRQVTVYALSADERPNASLTDAQRAARTALLTVINELRDPPGEQASYPVAALAVLSLPYPEQERPDAVGPAVAWPGPALPGEPVSAFGADGALTCVTVTGDAAARVLAAARTANTTTPWTAGGRTWHLRFRPLLPDESGCADLTGR